MAERRFIAAAVLSEAAGMRDVRATMLEQAMVFRDTKALDLGPERRREAKRLRAEAAEIRRDAALLHALHNLAENRRKKR